MTKLLSALVLSFAFVSFGCDSDDKKSTLDAAVDVVASDAQNSDVTTPMASDSGSLETGSAETSSPDSRVSEDGSSVVTKDAPAPSLDVASDTASDATASDSSVD